MAYIGKSPITGKFQKLDDISSGFNDSTTTFAVQSSGSDVIIESAQQLLVSIDGVLQEPTTAYTTSSSGITFTEAPNTNATFFAILLGETGVVNINSVTPNDLSVTTAKIAANAVTHVKLAADAVGTPQIKNGEVTLAKLTTGTFPINAANIATDAVETAKIKDINVTTAKIADDAITNLKISPNILFRGTATFMGATKEQANLYGGNVKGGDKAVITVDNQNNGVVYFTSNSHESSEHTVNFINMKGVSVGNATSFVVMITNNAATKANITKVQIDGSATNNFMFSGLTGTGSNTAGTLRYITEGKSNLDVYSFSVIKTGESSYQTLASLTNFT